MNRIALIAVVFAGCSDTPAQPTDANLDSPVDAADAMPDAMPRCPSRSIVDLTAPSEVQVVGDTGSTLGIFDPSIVYPAGANAGAMSYSSVPNGETIRTRIAMSSDAGASWGLVVEANQPEAVTLASSDATECPLGTCSGNLISEVSSLIIDPQEPDTQRRWKLFSHRYLVGTGVKIHYRIGTIAMQTAPNPNGPWSTPQKLIGWSSPSPYTSTGVVTNASASASTSDCIILSEPSALVQGGLINLSLGCVYISGGKPVIRVELFRSSDHAASWTSVGTLLHADDTSCLDGTSVNAAELFVSGGNTYVVASPSTDTGYHGCEVFPVEDLAHAAVRRNASGEALPSKLIVPSDDRFSGACSYGEGAGGFVLSTAYVNTPPLFRILRAQIAAP